MLMHHYEFFLDQRLAFRLHVGQLVIQQVECRCRKRNIGSGWVTCCSLLCKNRTLLLHHSCTMLSMCSSQSGLS